MSQLADHILQRLTTLLPLPKRQAALPPQLRDLHRALLRSLVERGRPLSNEEVAALAPGGDALAGLWTLAASDLIVLDPEGRPVGAYPVTIGRRTRWSSKGTRSGPCARSTPSRWRRCSTSTC